MVLVSFIGSASLADNCSDCVRLARTTLFASVTLAFGEQSALFFHFLLGTIRGGF